MKKILYTIIIITSVLTKSNAQVSTAAVVSVYTQGVKISPEMAESLLRIELTKSEKFNVFDKLDMLEILKEQQIDISNCFGKNCLLQIGKIAEVDKMITGSIENLGKKIVMTVKVLDINSGKYDKIAIEEFINLETELQIMMQITMNKALNIENDQDMLNNFVYYSQPPEAPITYTKNNGPRMGLAFVGGDMAAVLKKPKDQGGYNVTPLFTQIGYQFEGAYLSAGNFQALIEGMVLLTGIEQNMFNPSFAFINGFRSSKNGWEFGFGPTFRFTKMAKGYYSGNEISDGNWRLENDWYYDPDRVVLDSTTWNGGNSYVYTYLDNPNTEYDRMDSRGDIEFSAGWVWALGKTFHSGYLNIPVNAFFSHSKNGYYIGLSMGFNITKKD